ncbi:MAG: hypothetical protein COX62_01540 [Deltaproteobacteria bacterium CG_4_10_14_0_2_um_filter_43_8]|nr:MAG: hypothetical protein COV43_09080 [Deltaproteobacteria bacterium CG11_big_fil_rev_8_21_14_0_20_42_23]PJA21732.1 MAG: hypothetical protein COX62_01540 [Deltaproteobacteria bacterium CG_4_10_14_0_2_um_filter_43_8]PJC63428.1 MAG: hypothetical protein CO021_09690 [Deltaproteobacteria bacterium CG_4_9_14_0_2_um_filter_42_21]
MFRFFSVLFVCALLFSAGCSSCGGASSNVQLAIGLGPNDDLDQDGIINSEDTDADGDTVENTLDCNDLDAAIFPGAADLPDDAITDSNCDGIDGNKSEGVWVSANEGEDANDGSFESPVKNIAQALNLAAALPEGSRNVHLVKGVYAEDVTLENNINLFGGYGLLEDGVRSRDFTANLVDITGVPATLTYPLELHSGNQNLRITFLAQNTTSTIDALHVVGEQNELNFIASNANLEVSNSHFELLAPTVNRNVAVNALLLTKTAENTDFTVRFRKSIFTNRGTDVAGPALPQGYNAIVLAFPEINSEGNLEVVLQENQMTSEGRSESHFGISVTDDENNKNDDNATDQRARFSLRSLKNNLDFSGEHSSVTAVSTGLSYFTPSFADVNQEQLTFSELLQAEGNRIFLHGNIGSFVGISVWLARESSRIVNNEIYATQGGSGFAGGIFSMMSQSDILHNSIFLNNVENDVGGIILSYADVDAFVEHFLAHRAQRVNNNLISVHQEALAGCNVFGLYEFNNSAGAEGVHAASPLTFQNNLIHLNSSCDLAIYYDFAAAGNNPIGTSEDLNSKVGFDADDPSTISGNISADPLFNNLVGNALTVDAASPAVDQALPEESVSVDRLEVARPQGAGPDIGAHER